ncbi:MAG: C4-dicarboxylate TRAP transporter substrate-binding protein [Spirochaetes bacterium]|nr:C4-dicarboxylate TRAP transporter substrate-binding protein [Spirochaetota bacterium]
MKKIIFLICAAGLIGVFSGCAKSGSDDGMTYELKLGTVLTEKDPVYKGYEELKKNVEAKTKGKLIISLYPSSQLGADKDILEQAKLGTNVAVITDSSRLAEIVPEFGIMAAPYVFENYDEIRKFIETDLFKQWSAKFAGSGYKMLSFNWYQGDRHFLTKVPVEKPSDLKGIRIRSMGSKIAIDSLNAMGANATPLPWSEVYTGIQQKAIDGAEAQLPAVDGAKLYEVISHVALTGHFQLNTGLVTSEKWFDSLPAEYQKILLEESVKAGDYASKLTLDGLKQYQKNMEAAGVTFHKVDLKPFIDASQKVYKDNNLFELKAQIDKALGK